MGLRNVQNAGSGRRDTRLRLIRAWRVASYFGPANLDRRTNRGLHFGRSIPHIFAMVHALIASTALEWRSIALALCFPEARWTNPTALAFGIPFACAQILNRRKKFAERARGNVCSTSRAACFVDHKRQTPVARDAAELDRQARASRFKVTGNREIPTIPDKRAPGGREQRRGKGIPLIGPSSTKRRARYNARISIFSKKADVAQVVLGFLSVRFICPELINEVLRWGAFDIAPERLYEFVN
jgi:hypothetical protein